MALSWLILLCGASTAGGLRAPRDPSSDAISAEQAAAEEEHAALAEEMKRGGCRSDLPKVSAWMQDDSSSGCRGRPDRSVWTERLERSVRDGAMDPCKSDIIAQSVGRKIGFGSRINTLADELLVAVYGGFSLSLCNGTRDCNDGLTRIWAPHFENRAGISSCDSDDSPCRTSRHDPLLGVARLGMRHSRHLGHADRDYIEDLKRFLYSVIWEISPAMQTRVDEALRDSGLDTGRPYVGVHVRRGDKKFEATPVETDVYANATRPLLGPHSIRSTASQARLGAPWMDAVRRQLEGGEVEQVLVCSDDELAVEEFRVALGGRARVVSPPASNVKTRSYDSEDSVLGVLVAIEGLRRAHAFVGTASSNIGRLVYFLRPKGSKSISMDLDGDWLKLGW